MEKMHPEKREMWPKKTAWEARRNRTLEGTSWVDVRSKAALAP
jgi:hypothetical protein